jgi:hypothetical protein
MRVPPTIRHDARPATTDNHYTSSFKNNSRAARTTSIPTNTIRAGHFVYTDEQQNLVLAGCTTSNACLERISRSKCFVFDVARARACGFRRNRCGLPPSCKPSPRSAGVARIPKSQQGAPDLFNPAV